MMFSPGEQCKGNLPSPKPVMVIFSIVRSTKEISRRLSNGADELSPTMMAGRELVEDAMDNDTCVCWHEAAHVVNPDRSNPLLPYSFST